jgi:hypothetical protein
MLGVGGIYMHTKLEKYCLDLSQSVFNIRGKDLEQVNKANIIDTLSCL